MRRPRLIWPETAPARALGRAQPPGTAGAPRLAPRFFRLPTVAGAETPSDDAIGLLQVAAEVEHALLVQYLYAAASVTSVSGTPPLNAKAKITAVAIEEMGHLVTVQNLLLAIGDRESHHFGRDLLREASEFNPIPFVLEPLSHASLAKYVTVERPEDIADETLRARVAALEEEARQSSGLDPRRIGELYAAIYWLMQPDDEPFGRLSLSVADGFRPGWHVAATDFLPADHIHAHATVLDEWHGFPDLVVHVADDAATACAALFEVMAQGEGITSQEDSHFEEFLELVDAFEAGRFTIAPAPRTPFVAGQIRPADPAAIELVHPYTRLWAQLFNLIYGHLLVSLAHALFLPRADPAREPVREAALKAMRPVVVTLIRQLQRLRVSETGTAPAAPPFGIITDDLPGDATAFMERHRRQLADEDAIIAAITARGEFQTCVGDVCTLHDPAGRNALQVVADFQRLIREVIPQ